jgi:hypothetical protein
LLGYSVLEGVGSDITTLPDFVRAKFTRFENWESTSSAGWDFKLFIPTCNIIVCAKFICHEIDMRRLIAGSHRKGEKVTTNTIEDASFVASEMNFAQTIMLHVGINNFP